MTHIAAITPASASCSRRCKGTGSEDGNDFCLQIDQADAGVAFVWRALRSQTAPRAARGRETAVLLSAAKLRCALWPVTIGFPPPRFTSTLQFQ